MHSSQNGNSSRSFLAQLIPRSAIGKCKSDAKHLINICSRAVCPMFSLTLPLVLMLGIVFMYAHKIKRSCCNPGFHKRQGSRRRTLLRWTLFISRPSKHDVRLGVGKNLGKNVRYLTCLFEFPSPLFLCLPRRYQACFLTAIHANPQPRAVLSLYGPAQGGDVRSSVPRHKWESAAVRNYLSCPQRRTAPAILPGGLRVPVLDPAQLHCTVYPANAAHRTVTDSGTRTRASQLPARARHDLSRSSSESSRPRAPRLQLRGQAQCPPTTQRRCAPRRWSSVLRIVDGSHK
jgi:hypothetical protein